MKEVPLPLLCQFMKQNNCSDSVDLNFNAEGVQAGLFSSKDSVCVIARNEAISRLQCGGLLRQNVPCNDITAELNSPGGTRH